MAVNEQARRNAQLAQGMSTRQTPTSTATVQRLQSNNLQDRIANKIRTTFPQTVERLRKFGQTPVKLTQSEQNLLTDAQFIAQEAARGGSKLVPFVGNYLYEKAIKPSMGGELAPATKRGEMAGKVAYVAPAAATLRAAPSMGLSYGVKSATLSGVLSKALGGSFTEGATEGFVNAPVIGMVGTITNPIIGKSVALTGRSIKNPFTKQLATRSVSSILNIAEGVPMDMALGQQPLTTQSIVIDGISGFLLTPGANKDLVDSVLDLQKNKLDASKKSILKVQEALQKPESKEIIKQASDDIESGKSVGQIEDEALGFKPGVKQEFDNALLKKDKNTIIKLLPNVPDEYKQRFKTEIEIATGQKLPAPTNPKTQELLNKIIRNFEVAQEARTKQEDIYTEQRARRVAEAEQLGEELTGKKLQIARKGVLSGEFDKVEMKPEDTITKEDVDYLFNEIENIKDLTFFERLRAKDALEQLFTEGKPPIQSDLNILKRIYGENFADEVKKNSKSFRGLGEQIIETLGLTRALTTIGDFSAIFRQGFWFSTRKEFWKNLPKAFRYAFDPNYTRQQMEAIYELESIRAQAEIPVGQRLAITELEGGLSKGEEAFLGSAIINKVPVLGKIARGSERSYVGFLNSLRAAAYETMYQEAKKSGALDADPKLLSKMAEYVNSATGRGNLNDLPEAAQGIMNAVLFSPRLQKSRIDLLNPLKFPMMGSFIRRQYARDLISNVTLGLTVLGLAKLAGAEVGTDPTSADFGKIKVGNTRVDIWGGFQQYAVLLSRLWLGRKTSSVTGIESEFTGALDILKGDFSKGSGFNPNNMLTILTDFAENKTSPNTRLALSLFRGLKDANGNKLSLTTEALNITVPLILQQFVEAYEQEGLGFAIATTLPAAVGFNVATYGEQVPRIGETESGAPKVEYAYEPTFGDIVKEKLAGIPYTTLSQQEQEVLIAKRDRETAEKFAIQEAKKRVKKTGRTEIVAGKEIRLVQGEPTEYKLKELSYQPQDPAIAVEDDILAEGFFRNITGSENVPQELLNYLDRSPERAISNRVIAKIYKNDPNIVKYLEDRGLFTEDMANRIVLEKAIENPDQAQQIVYKRLNNLVTRKEEIGTDGANLILTGVQEGVIDRELANKIVSDYKGAMTKSAKNKLIGDVAVYKMTEREAPVTERETYLKKYINEIKTTDNEVGADAINYLIKLYEQDFISKTSIRKILQGESATDSAIEKYKKFINTIE
jgi:hypothetical protein